MAVQPQQCLVDLTDSLSVLTKSLIGFLPGLKLQLVTMCEVAHENHWLIPEVLQNEMGHVTADYDKRVKRETTKRDCNKYQESCMKRKINA